MTGYFIQCKRENYEMRHTKLTSAREFRGEYDILIGWGVGVMRSASAIIRFCTSWMLW